MTSITNSTGVEHMATAPDIKVESGIPVPGRKGARTYPFADMKVGDSFLVPGARSSADISSAVSYRKNRYHESYACRAVPGGVRVWRVA